MCSAEDTTNDGLAVSLNNHDYTYDTYGNLIIDDNKGITAIAYNHLNLPTKVIFGTRGYIDYIYTADGIKLEKKVTTLEPNTTEVTTSYRDGFQYSNTIDNTTSVLDFFPHAEGTVTVTLDEVSGAMSFNYVFHYTDHLGNIRLRYALDPETNALAILEEKHYYPFGLQHSGYNTGNRRAFKTVNSKVELTPVNPFIGDSYKYGFGGKEYQDELDLNLYDVSARNYDPALGRWMNIDPLAEQMRRHSPYNFAFDNPVVFSDPDGMSPATELFNTKGIKIGEDAGGNDGNVSIVSNNVGESVKDGDITIDDAIAGGQQTTRTELKEANNVLNRVMSKDNGGLSEESSVVDERGNVTEGERGPEYDPDSNEEIATAELPDVPGDNNTSIHGHLTSKKVSSSALKLGPKDSGTFKGFKRNIIVGRLGPTTEKITKQTLGPDRVNTIQPKTGAVFFNRNGQPTFKITTKAINKILKQ